MIPTTYYQTKPIINQWKDFESKVMPLMQSDKQWIFRGQKALSNKDCWDFQTSLERAIINFGIYDRKEQKKKFEEAKDKTKLGNLHRAILRKGVLRSNNKYQSTFAFEGGLLRTFKRQCHHYISQVPEPENIIEWFALMRHYRAPTRLLDWTYSAYVALHMALEEAEEDFAVWAFDSGELKEPCRKILTDLSKKGSKKPLKAWKDDDDISEFDTFNKLFIRKKPVSFIAAVNPYHLNDRLTIQKGVFLCPGSVAIPFEDNMMKILGKLKNPSESLIKYEIRPNDKREFLRMLGRMNISSATLYPGLEGFARSLTNAAAFPGAFTHDHDWGVEK